MTEFDFFIRFLKDKKVYDSFLENLYIQNSLYREPKKYCTILKRLLSWQNNTPQLIDYLLDWESTDEGFKFWKHLYEEYARKAQTQYHNLPF